MLRAAGIIGLGLGLGLSIVAVIPRASARDFAHPGLLHTRAELDRVKAKIATGEEPWRTAWSRFVWSSHASVQWKPSPEAHVFRDNRQPWRGARELGDDALAAYANAIHYALSGDEHHARTAANILNAWSTELETITGHDDKLLVGIVGYKLCNAAEILRHTWPEWSASDQERFRDMLLRVCLPVINDFFPEANGNWDASMIVTMMSIGVYCDDEAIYDRARHYFLHGSGNGALTNYVLPSGECQESTRDQQHTQLGLGYLADACEIGWNQGDDLWGAYESRIAVGFEYTARYNLGFDVPARGRVSEEGRGRFRPIYEKVYRHYHGRRSLEMPFTRAVVLGARPEGSHWDHVSWGTLLFAEDTAVGRLAGPDD
jgi:hypothetical protein